MAELTYMAMSKYGFGEKMVNNILEVKYNMGKCEIDENDIVRLK